MDAKPHEEVLAILVALEEAVAELRHAFEAGELLSNTPFRSGLVPGADQVYEAVGHLLSRARGLLRVHVSDFAVALLSDRPLCLDLQRVVAFSVRWQPTLLADGYISKVDRAFSLVAIYAINLCSVLISPCPEVAGYLPTVAIDFARTLLRTQTLQCCSQQAAGVAAAVLQKRPPAASTPATYSPGPHAQPGVQADDGPEDAGQGVREYGCAVLSWGFTLLFALSQLASRVRKCATQTGGGSSGEAAAAAGELLRRRSFVRELTVAMCNSSVMDHCARALLLLNLPPEDPDPLAPWPAPRYWVHQFMHCHLVMVAANLHGAWSGRCVQFLVLAAAVATLRAADGGTTYGLAQRLLRCLPVPDLRTLWFNQEVRAYVLNCVLANFNLVMASAADGTAPAPVGRRAALALLFRTAHCCEAWVLEWARLRDEEAADRAAAGPPPDPRQGDGVGVTGQHPQSDAPDGHLFSTARKAFETCVGSLRTARVLLKRPGAARLVESEAEYWRLVTGVARHIGMTGIIQDRLLIFAGLLEPFQPLEPIMEHYADLPPVPPDWLRVALSNGLLPCLERLLRRAGEAPGGPETTVLVHLLPSVHHLDVSAYLGALLAFGEPRMAASLAATLGKVLRRLASQLPETGAAGPSAAGTAVDSSSAPALSSNNSLVLCICLSLSWVLIPGHPFVLAALDAAGQWQGLGTSGAGPSSSSAQLAQRLLCGAFDWLPELCRLWMASLNQPGAHDWVRFGVDVAVLSWLPSLAFAASENAVAGAIAAGIPTDVATAAAAGIRRSCMVEPQVVALLGAVLGAGREVGNWTASTMVRIVNCCAAVAAVFPADVQAAALASSRGGGGNASGGRRLVRGGHGPERRGGRASRAARTSAAGAGGVPGAAAARGISLTAGAAASGGVQGSGWLPESFRYMQEVLSNEGASDTAATAGNLASVLEHWAAGLDDLALAPAGGPLFQRVLPALLAARGALRTCANPRCTNLAADSEAELPLRQCSGCGAVSYCSRECQLAHRRGGHKALCGGG